MAARSASFASPPKSQKTKKLKRVKAGKFEAPKLKNSGTFNPGGGTITPLTPQPGGKPGVGSIDGPPPPPPPPPAPVPPPPTLRGEQNRQDATNRFNTTRAGLATDLFDAAFRFGDNSVLTPEMRAQFGLDNTDIGVNDSSDLATIARGRAESGLALDENLNEGNTFFSGMRLKKQTGLDDDARRARDEARINFTRSFNNLAKLLAQAQDERDVGIGEGDILDIESAAATPPEAEVTPAQGQFGNPNPPPPAPPGVESIRQLPGRVQGEMVGVTKPKPTNKKKTGKIKQVPKKKKGKK